MQKSIRLRDGRTVRVRRAAGPDAEAIHHHFQFGLTRAEREARGPLSLPTIRRRLREPSWCWYLALAEGGEVVAEAAYLHDTVASGDAVVSVSVATGWRKSGLGLGLIRATWPQPGSVERVLAGVAVANTGSRRLFDKLLAELGGERHEVPGMLIYTLPVGRLTATGDPRARERITPQALADLMRPAIVAKPGEYPPRLSEVANLHGVNEVVAERAYWLLEWEWVLERDRETRRWRKVRTGPRWASDPSTPVLVARALAESIEQGELLPGDALSTREVAATQGVSLDTALYAFDPLLAHGFLIPRRTAREHRYVVAAAGVDWHWFSARQLVSGAALHGIAAAEAIELVEGAAATRAGVVRLEPKSLLAYPGGRRFRLFFVSDHHRRLLLLAAGTSERRAAALATRVTGGGRLRPHREALDELPLALDAVLWGSVRWRELGLSPAIEAVRREWQRGALVVDGIGEEGGLTFVGLPHRKLLVVTGRAGDEVARAAADEVLATDQYVRSHEASD